VLINHVRDTRGNIVVAYQPHISDAADSKVATRFDDWFTRIITP
jgi:hypothetical protein